ncbi:MAG: tetratricopeptide repeat protein [Gemmatimonadaceae bacterium]
MQFDRDQILERARALAALRRWKDAVAELERALALDPGDATAHCHMAVAYLELREVARALESADRAVERAPDEEWGHRLRAIALLRLGKPKPALAAAEESVRLSPLEPFALQTLFAVQSQMKKLREAGQTAELLLRLRPDDADAHTNVGLIAIRRSKWKEAESHCRRALEIDPRNTDALNNLGVALLNLRRRREAILAFYQALSLRPTHGLAQRNLRLSARRYLRPVGVIAISVGVLRGVVETRGNATLLTVGVVVVALFAYWMWSRRRMASLPPDIRDAIRADPARLSPREWLLGSAFIVVTFGFVGLVPMLAYARTRPWQLWGMWIAFGIGAGVLGYLLLPTRRRMRALKQQS